jgi:hypothetical protein
MNTQLATTNDINNTSSILNKTIKGLAEGLTGLASSQRRDLILSVGYLFQSMLTGNFLETLIREWDKFRSEGKIKDDYQYTEQHKTCLKEMLDFLDTDKPDETRFTFLKKIFLIISTEKISDKNSLLPQQYMRICRSLTSGEILTLIGNYKIVLKGEFERNTHNVELWLKDVASASGLVHKELVSVHETNLIKKGLITERTYSDKSGFRATEYFRLTGMGYEICKFIEAYDQDISSTENVNND